MITTPLFSLGILVATPGAVQAMNAARHTPAEFLARHVSGDWGDLDLADIAENNLSVLKGFRILSAYHTRLNVKLWIITEADRSSTCFLLPDEY